VIREKNKSNSCGIQRVYKGDSAGIATFFDTIGGIEHVILENRADTIYIH
jgi:uncharacterized protein YbbK (DUF523 family)